jgi:NADH dehydrogenase
MTDAKRVVIVGGGFAGLGCARRLAMRDDIRVTLIDKDDYHQFQPLFYPDGHLPARFIPSR